MNERFDKVDAKFEKVDKKFDWLMAGIAASTIIAALIGPNVL